MKKMIRLVSVLALAAFFSGSALLAYETEFEDKKMDGVPHQFKIDGVLFPRFEFTDENQVGAPDSAGNTGFHMERVYVNFKGKIKDGFWKGMSYRVTSDVGRAADQNVLGDAGTDDNDYLFLLKYAYVNLPLGYGMSLRLGQQHIPGVDGKGGTSLQKNWGHRYISKTSTEDVKMSASTDQGLAFILKNPYFGLHLLFGNGEGYHHGNGEDLDTSGTKTLVYNSRGSDSDSLHFLSAGRPGRESHSYGYDLYGMLSVKPTGKNKQVEVNLAVPFRFQNVTGVIDDEYKYLALGIETGNEEFPEKSANFRYVQGEKRAFQDVWYGGEAAVKVKTGITEIGGGVGTVVHHDKRGLAYAIDEDTFPATGGGTTGDQSTTDFSKFTNLADQVNYDKDVWVTAQYGFIHAKVGPVGGYYRLTTGEGASRLDRVNRSGHNPLTTYLIADYYTDGTGQANKFGDMTYSQLNTYLSNRRLSLNNQNYMKYEYGITWYANKRFRLSVGLEETVSSNRVTGYQTRTNPYSTVGTKDSPDTSYISNVENNAAFAKRQEIADTNAQLDELFGKQTTDRQIYVRSQMKF